MLRASLAKEIVIRTLNDIGVVAEITKALADRGIGIRAASAWVEGEYGIIHLVTDDDRRAFESIPVEFEPREQNVLVIEVAHKPGMLKSVAERLKIQGIDIHHLYATALQDHERCLIVLHTSHDDRARLALQ